MISRRAVSFSGIAVLAFALAAMVACNDNQPNVIEDNGFDVCGIRAQEGCGCDVGEVAGCYPQEPLVDESGEEYCVRGIRRCLENGLWGECEFEDGAARLPILGNAVPCGGCEPNCTTIHDCPSGRDITEENSEYVRYDLDREGLILGGSIFNARYAYVANDPDSTVSKFDLETGQEVGRFRVGLAGVTNRPSRTAIDSRGNAFVANRAFGAQGSVTKIAGDTSYCYDRNMNGVIETSTGSIPRALNDDECVLWTVPVGPVDGLPRALAVDAEDRVWVGLWRTQRFDVLSPDDGHLIDSVNVTGRPYGAAISSDGTLWYPNSCCDRRFIQPVNVNDFTAGATFTPPNGLCNGSYGIAVDFDGRVLIGGYPRSCFLRFTPPSTWESFSTTNGAIRGITIDADRNIWAASHTSGGPAHWLTRWNDDGSGRQVYTLIDTSDGDICSVPIGVGADFSRRIWTPCQNTSRVARLDPDTGRVDIWNTGAHPYTYSDFTGFLRATITSPEGFFTQIYDSYESCHSYERTDWDLFYFNGEAPPDSEIRFVARFANQTTQFGMAQEIEVARITPDPATTTPSPVVLEDVMNAATPPIPNGMRYMEMRVQLRLLDEDATSPVFRNMDIVYYCACDCDISAECDSACECDRDCAAP